MDERFAPFNIILASASPRRKQLLTEIGIPFSVKLKPVKEEFPSRLKHFEISDYLAQLKAIPFKDSLKPNDILITSDTIVWHNNRMLGKPKTEEEAYHMLQTLSNSTHEVITSVCFTTTTFEKTLNSITKVTFHPLSDAEIRHYINTSKPFDKAGAYGIQDWIGKIGVKSIEGSYFNVVGFPVDLVYKTLLEITAEKNFKN